MVVIHFRERKMKRILHYYLLFQIGFIVISCNKNPVEPSGSVSENYHTVSGTVLDQVYPDVSPFYKASVPVVLDNDTAISGSLGEYSFIKVPKGNHIISVSLPDYEYYQDTITVWSDTIKNIYLYGIKADYFPTIQVNSQKRFKYDSGGGFGGGYSSGEALWSFDSLKEENGNQIYSVKETLIYTRTSSWGSPQVDTAITLFKIIEDNFHRITIGLYPWDGINFNRYLDPRQGNGDIIKISSLGYEISISLKKNVGLYKMEMHESAHLSYIIYELIE